MKVAYFIYQSRSTTNGSIVSASMLLDELLGQTEIEHIIITNMDGSLVRSWRNVGHRVSVLPYRYSLRRNNRHDDLASLLVAEQIDIAHCNTPNDLWYGLSTIRKVGVRCIWTVRGTSTLDYKNIDVSRACHRRVALSEEMRQLISRKLPDNVPIVVIPSIVKISTQTTREEARKMLGLDPNMLAVAVVGRLQGSKGQLQLLRSMRKLLSHQLFFLGELKVPWQDTDSYYSSCVEAARRCPSPERVHILDHQSNMPVWYRAMDLVMVVSATEGLSRAMIESMAHGTPVVIVDVCSATETLEATGSGLVRHDGDLTGMLDDVEELIHDGERLRLMGQIGERVARERFSGEASLSRHLDMYRSVLIDSPNKLRVRHRH